MIIGGTERGFAIPVPSDYFPMLERTTGRKNLPILRAINASRFKHYSNVLVDFNLTAVITVETHRWVNHRVRLTWHSPDNPEETDATVYSAGQDRSGVQSGGMSNLVPRFPKLQKATLSFSVDGTVPSKMAHQLTE